MGPMANLEMTCKDVVELVTAYLDGSMPPGDRERFEAHLKDCPYCSRYLDQMRETIRLVGRLSEESLDRETRDELMVLFRTWTEESPSG